ncbi:aldehyde dehydrogenase [Escherichia coli]|nr:aldehyde dehydrogenase [Escherichia coli]
MPGHITIADLNMFHYRVSSKGNDSNLLIVFYVQIMPDDFVMQLHRF